MAKQVKKQKPAKTKKVEEVVDETATAEKTRDEKLAEYDAVLDDIEDVLEENAELFVSEYRQRGGQ